MNASDLEQKIELRLSSNLWVLWLLISVLALLFGIYLGYEYESGQSAKDREALVSAQNEAMNQAEARRQDAADRGAAIERDFLGKLSNLHITNTTVHETVQRETQKLVYTDCKLPDTGVDLLNGHINSINLRLVGSEK